MTLWIAYTTKGQEFALVEDCAALGIVAIAPRKVEAVRTGNRRWPEPRVTPYLSNYVFVTATETEWHRLKDIKYVRDIMDVPPAWEPRLAEFCDTVESQFAARMREIEKAKAVMRDRDATKEARRAALASMQHYQPGDLLEVICGPLAGQIVAFGAMVEREASKQPEIEVALQGMGWGTVRVDPLAVRRAG